MSNYQPNIEGLSCEDCVHYVIIDACFCECCTYPGDEYCGLLTDKEHANLPDNFSICDKFVNIGDN